MSETVSHDFCSVILHAAYVIWQTAKLSVGSMPTSLMGEISHVYVAFYRVENHILSIFINNCMTFMELFKNLLVSSMTFDKLLNLQFFMNIFLLGPFLTFLTFFKHFLRTWILFFESTPISFICNLPFHLTINFFHLSQLECPQCKYFVSR